jgi:SAM-dependent methyltransferase
MGHYFCKPRPRCIGHVLCKYISSENLPLSCQASIDICEQHLPYEHDVPLFFKIRAEAQEEVGKEELESAYDRIHEDYDEFWLSEAGKPIEDLISRIPFKGIKSIFEAGCGTGFGTALLLEKLKDSASITAADLSEEMLALARKRIKATGFDNVRFTCGDALELLDTTGPFDLIFSSWVLGYIPLKPFFAAADRALKTSGKLAFVVHKENSPRQPLEIFGQLVAQDPSILLKRVAFDFPHDIDHTEQQLISTGFRVVDIWDGEVTFRYDTAQQVLEHLLKSGAGTAYYDAFDPLKRNEMERQFIDAIAQRINPGEKYKVIHDFICCIAEKT